MTVLPHMASDTLSWKYSMRVPWGDGLLSPQPHKALRYRCAILSPGTRLPEHENKRGNTCLSVRHHLYHQR